MNSFTKKTIKDINLKGKTVLASVDYNVPGDETGKVTDDYRISASLPTIKYLLSQSCKIILISHRGRPEGRVVARYSLEPVAEVLQRLLRHDVLFVRDCIGEDVEAKKINLKTSEILLLENTRFHAQEAANDSRFAKELAKQADVFVQDAFGNTHRKHASTEAITHELPSVAGLLVTKEVATISGAIANPARPLMAIIGGAKIEDKIDVIRQFIKMADFVAIGGAMANTFLLAHGMDVGKSLVDKSELSLARTIMDEAIEEAKKRRFVFYLPQDSIVATKKDKTAQPRIVDWDAHVIASIENYPKSPPRKSGQVLENEYILDVGPFTGAFIAGAIQQCDTVIWNGVMGVTEIPAVHDVVGPFAHGTELILEAMMGQFGHKPYSLIGGGDTSAYIEMRGLIPCFDHVSTGGGACLELLAGKKLPGIAALEDKK